MPVPFRLSNTSSLFQMEVIVDSTVKSPDSSSSEEAETEYAESYHSYEEIDNFPVNENVIFDSSVDYFEALKFNEKIDEIKIDMPDLAGKKLNETLRYCIEKPTLKKITIDNILRENLILHTIPTRNLELLTYVEINLLQEPDQAIDHLLPIVRCTKTLQTIKYTKGILSEESLEEINRNHKLNVLILSNVTITSPSKFRRMLTRMTKLNELEIIFQAFECFTKRICTIEAIFDSIFTIKSLKTVKIHAWQKYDLEILNQTKSYKVLYYSTPIPQGKFHAWTHAIVPLLKYANVHNFEIYYENNNLPFIRAERAMIKYSLPLPLEAKVKMMKHFTN